MTTTYTHFEQTIIENIDFDAYGFNTLFVLRSREFGRIEVKL